MKRALLLALVVAPAGRWPAGSSHARPQAPPAPAPPAPAPAAPPPPRRRARHGSPPGVRAPREASTPTASCPSRWTSDGRAAPASSGFVFQVLALLAGRAPRPRALRDRGLAAQRGRPRGPAGAHAGGPRLRPGALDLGDPARLRAGVRDHPHAVGAGHHRPEGGRCCAASRRLLERELVALGEGMQILPEDVREHARHVQALPRAGAGGAAAPRAARRAPPLRGHAAASPTPRPPRAASARARWTVSTPSCRCCATSPGPSPPSASSGRCAASATRWPRPTAPCRATSPA